MAYIPSSSFIPKDNMSPIPAQIRKKRTVHVFSFIATAMLMVSLIAAVGSFFYTGILESQLVAEKENLSKISKKDVQQKIAELETYSYKLTAVHNLLDNHIAPTRIFSALEKTTKGTIQFDSLKFTHKPGFEANIELNGKTEELSSVALQKIQFLKEELFSDFTVDEINLVTKSPTEEAIISDEEMEKPVSFSLSANFIKEKILYTGEITEVPQPIVEIPTTQSSTTTSTDSVIPTGVIEDITTPNI